MYSYVSMGEFVAFIIGWNLVLEYAIGTAAVAKAFSHFIDDITGKSISTFLTQTFPIAGCPVFIQQWANLSVPKPDVGNVICFSPFFDLIGLGIVLLYAMLLCWGTKESALVNNIMTAITLGGVVFVILVGASKWNFHNWVLTESDIHHILESKSHPCANNSHLCRLGKGGFYPFGVDGTLVGAAITFVAYIGFDVVAAAGVLIQILFYIYL